MVQRVFVRLAGAALLVSAAVPLMPRAAYASSLFCSPVGIGSVSPQMAAAGSTVTVNGSGFSGCSVQVKVGGTSASGVNVRSDAQLTFTAASGMYGTVSVTVSDGLGGSNTGAAHNFYVTPFVSTNQVSAVEGGTVDPVGGSGLTLGGYLNSVGIVYSACSGGSASVVGDSHLRITLPGGYCPGTTTLKFWGNPGPGDPGPIGPANVAGPSVKINPNVTQGPPATVAPGDAFSVSGSGFGPSGSAAPPTWSTGQWTDGAIFFKVPADATGNVTVSATRSDGTQVGSWPVAVASSTPSPTPPPNSGPAISSVYPSTVAPGGAFQINGSGFGQGQCSKNGAPSGGSVTVRGVPAVIECWAQNQIIADVPANLSPGSAAVFVNVGGAQSNQSSINVGQTYSGGGGTGRSGGSGGGSTPGVQPSASATSSPQSSNPTSIPTPSNPGFIPPSDNGPIISTSPAPFVKPPKPSGSPVDVAMSTATDHALPAHDIPFTVKVSAFGKPVAGTEVEVLLVYVPGDDAKVNPAKGVTDSAGELKGVIHLSRNAGDHIVLARSGQFSDEIRVTGRGAHSTGGAGGTSRLDSGLTGLVPSQKTIIVGLLAICVILFVTGFAIQLAMPRHKMTLATAGAGAHSGRRSPYGRARTAGAVLQFGMAMTVAIVGGALARLRRA
jgi:hypothetical protein